MTIQNFMMSSCLSFLSDQHCLVAPVASAKRQEASDHGQTFRALDNCKPEFGSNNVASFCTRLAHLENGSLALPIKREGPSDPEEDSLAAAVLQLP